jgi:hypothetical protein
MPALPEADYRRRGRGYAFFKVLAGAPGSVHGPVRKLHRRQLGRIL